MKIAIVAKLWESTQPFSTGGTGMSVGVLVNKLTERGHKVSLFATGDSKTKAQRLISVKKKPYQNDYSEIKEYQNIFNAFKQADKFDIIHTHVEHKAVFFAPLVKTPVLISLRYGEFFKDELELLKTSPRLNYSFNSLALRRKLKFLKSVGVVYNGLDLKLYPFHERADDYLLFLGRLSPQKGVKLAIQVARQTGHKLIIAGKATQTDKDYLERGVWPYVDKRQIIYVGEVKFKQKIKLLSQAKALVQPTRVFEACSNSLLEAQACGTPVITFNQGSNREIVKHGLTGLIVKPNQLKQAIKKIGLIRRSDCRQWIEENFTAEKMTEGYEKIYRRLINS